MSRSGDATRIPARITAEELAKTIGRNVSEVVAALKAREEPDSPEDYLDSEIACSVARSLGAEVSVETRDLVLEALYELDTRGEIDRHLEGRAQTLVERIIDSTEELDAEIESASKHWTVARMPVIDRNILRVGLYELKHEPETPVAVVVSEGVRLAQTYSTERSAPFVNGVLASLAKSTPRG